MRWWRPPPGQPERLDWWRPLLFVSRRARQEQVPWPVHVGEFTLGGRVDRGPRPAVWVYVHERTGEEVLADDAGHTYDFVRYRSGPSIGRFKEIDVRQAVWRARLPHVVEPAWREKMQQHDADDELAPTPTATRRRHLRLVSPSG
jgi:hypothetical protein